jgi:small subunit ribosomal protein S17
MDNHAKTGRKDEKASQASANLASALGVSTRGKFFEGTVISDRMQGSVVVEWPRIVKSTKYNRYSRLTSKVKARSPKEIGAKEGDFVRVEETRKISKTINFIVTRVIRKKGEVA